MPRDSLSLYKKRMHQPRRKAPFESRYRIMTTAPGLVPSAPPLKRFIGARETVTRNWFAVELGETKNTPMTRRTQLSNQKIYRSNLRNKTEQPFL
jgi:hypothetical protein